MRTTSYKDSYKKGFTLVELLVSISIFAFMTAFVAVKYGTFSQGILLTNLAYDIALTIRQAQSYGISVKDSSGFTNLGASDFEKGYGVYFSTTNDKEFIFYVDGNNNYRYDTGGGDYKINTFSIKKGNKINKLCSGSGSANCNTTTVMSVAFKRPDPSPVIIDVGGNNAKYSEIELSSPDGTTTKIIVRDSGQISIE